MNFRLLAHGASPLRGPAVSFEALYGVAWPQRQETHHVETATQTAAAQAAFC
jgi:hypothetical protein